MCGRYGLYDVSDDELLKANDGYDFTPNYNVAPTQTMPIIIEKKSKKFVKPMQWGIHRILGPNFEKNIFNTRSEKAFERFWGKTVRTSRCVVPANGFYEWRTSGIEKIPYWIHAKQLPLLYFAGIYSVDSEGNPRYSIMTTTPNAEMADIHTRMPVVLEADAKALWLDETVADGAVLAELLKPLPDGKLELMEVSKSVNNVRNNNGTLLSPVNSK